MININRIIELQRPRGIDNPTPVSPQEVRFLAHEYENNQDMLALRNQDLRDLRDRFTQLLTVAIPTWKKWQDYKARYYVAMFAVAFEAAIIFYILGVP